MTTPHAAAERLREHYEAEAAKKATGDTSAYRKQSPYWNGGHNSHIGQDYKILADAYLTEHASDADAITAERLEALGFEWDNPFFRFPLSNGAELLVKTAGGGVDVRLWNHADMFHLPDIYRTLGDVRKLLIGLGAKLP